MSTKNVETKNIKIAEILTDQKALFEYDVRSEGITRVEGNDDPSVVSLVEYMKSGKEIPSILVYQIAKDRYQLVNGRRRTIASRSMGLKEIKARVIKAGTKSPSQLLQLSFLDDVANGNSLDVTEKRDTFKRYITMTTAEKKPQETQEELSRKFGISQATVSRVISEAKKKGEVPKDYSPSGDKRGRKEKYKPTGKTRTPRQAQPPELVKAKQIFKSMEFILRENNKHSFKHLKDMILQKGEKGKEVQGIVNDFCAFADSLVEVLEEV